MASGASTGSTGPLPVPDPRLRGAGAGAGGGSGGGGGSCSTSATAPLLALGLQPSLLHRSIPTPPPTPLLDLYFSQKKDDGDEHDDEHGVSSSARGSNHGSRRRGRRRRSRRSSSSINDNINSMGTETTGELDLFVLTFNCAKTPVDVPVFARHLREALLQRQTDGGAHTGRAGRRRKDEVESLDGLEEDEEEQAAREGQGERNMLPDLVVFSLQEIAPLTYGYLGGQFLSPYFNPFKEALNLAALELEQSSRTGPSSSSSTTTTTTENSNNNLLNPRANLQRSRSTLSTLFQRQPDYPYKLIEARNVGMTAIMLFARKPDAIHHIQHAECAFGIANMGNKGAIALRVMYAADGAGEGEGGVTGKAASEEAEGERRVVEVTFVATHLAAMEYNLRRRNANWMSICSSCLFEDPKKILPEEYHFPEPGSKNVIEASTHSSSTTPNAKQTDGGEDIPSETEEERQALLERLLNDASMPDEYVRHMHDISIFKPGSHLFVAGDLNYRISTTTPHALDVFPTLETYPDFFERDQLTQERTTGRALRGLTEAPVTFPPTYKIKHLSREKAQDAVNKEEFQAAVAEGREDDVVPWKWASHRWPGWCDRVLFLDIPNWVKRRYTDDNDNSSNNGGPSRTAPEIKVYAYQSLPTMLTSDHQPVFLRASVPLLPPEALMRPTPSSDPLDEDKEDPRCHLPIPIDTGAFARRAAARRREVITGMTALFFSTKEGAIVVAAITVVGLWTWWLYQGLF